MKAIAKCVVLLIGFLGMATSEAAENSPNAPTQDVPGMAQATVAPQGATTSTLQTKHARKMRILGVCAPTTSASAGHSLENLTYPILMAQQYYFHHYEHRDVPGAATITVQQHPKHGKLRSVTEADRGTLFWSGTLDPNLGLHAYIPDQGYAGKDRATILVDFSGVKVQVNYYFQVVDTPLGDDSIERYCSKTGHTWQMSSAPPEEIPPPIVTEDKASLVGRQISERVISPVFPGRYNKYTSANPLIVSPDGLHVTYVAGFGAKTEAEYGGEGDDGWKYHYLIMDGKKGKYDSVTDFQYSPDSKHIAYRVIASNNGLGGVQSFFVVDEREGEHYVIGDGPIRYLSDPKFSPDSSHFAYQISASAAVGPDYVVVDGKKGKAYANISRYNFSPDGQHVAYTASDYPSGHFVVVDGKEGKRYDWVSAPNRRDGAAPVFSPDSKRVAYFAESRTGAKREIFTVVNGREGKRYPGIENYLEFSPDSRRLLYLAQTTNRKWSVVVDEKEGKYYDSISTPIFSSDSQRTAYIVKTQANGGEAFVVVDGKEGKHYSGKNVSLHSLIFSLDSKRVTYTVHTDDTWFIVVDGKEYAEGTGQVIFSPKGVHFAYVGSRVKGKQFFIVDGKEGKPYDLVLDPVFSPDGKSFAYAAYTETYTEKGKKWRVVVNGKAGRAYDMVLAKGAYDHSSTFQISSLHFDAPDKFHYLAVSGKNIVLVEEKLDMSKTK